MDDGKKKLKARLVARGFEEKNANVETESPTCGKQALRLVFITAASTLWELQSIDISSAFLEVFLSLLRKGKFGNCTGVFMDLVMLLGPGMIRSKKK